MLELSPMEEDGDSKPKSENRKQENKEQTQKMYGVMVSNLPPRSTGTHILLNMNKNKLHLLYLRTFSHLQC